ncbi:MAG TPA: hypothetical protein VJP78_15020 [Thermoleophilia bacterium]|nr:hypothetical protein [Thermoleophilia bacterium]
MGEYDKYICTTLEKRHLLPGPTPAQRDRLAAQGKRISMEHLHWIDEEVIPGAYYGETTWIWPPTFPNQVTWEELAKVGYETPGMFPHVHGFPELLSWWGSNPDDFGETDPMGMQMGDEIIPLKSSWVAYIPANLPHMPVFHAGVRSQLYTRPTLHWVSGPGGVYTREKDDETKKAEAEEKAPPTAREVEPAKSRYGRYIVYGTPPDVRRPEFMRPLDPVYSRPMAYIDQTVIPDAEFGCDTRWLLPGDRSNAGQRIMDPHTLPHGTSIACIAMNYDDITDLCAEVELFIGGEKHLIHDAFWAYIPPNVSQGPMTIRNITKQVFFMMSWPMGEGLTKYPGGR